ncbi:MAG: discoidin domain-containing protein [Polyangiales bacterium]
MNSKRFLGLTVCAALPVLLLASGCRHRETQAPPPGYSYPPAAPPNDDARTLVTRDLGAVADDQCSLAALLPQVGPRCKAVTGSQATGSEAATSFKAFDGDACSAWDSGATTPRFVAVDFGALRTVTGVLVVAQTTPPVATAKHTIEASDDGTKWTVAYIIEGQMGTQRAYSIPFQSPVTARYLRVTSDVGGGATFSWREITALDCS